MKYNRPDREITETYAHYNMTEPLTIRPDDTDR